MTDKALHNIHLKEFHKSKSAKFVSFAGYEMPINYKNGIINEHQHVRNHTGIFDVSHMGQVLILFTNDNIKALESYIPLSLNVIPLNKCHYSFFLNSNGGIIDDIILSKIKVENENYIYIVYNSSRKNVLNKIFENIVKNFKIIQKRCLIAIQGPSSYSDVKSIINVPSSMKFLDIEIIKYENEDIYVSRSGYTGEDGFEISIINENAEKLIIKTLDNNNAILCGLGCRDSLRVEAGLSLYGNEINEEITPIQAGLSWALDKSRLQDDNLNGSKILYEQLQSPLDLKKIGFSPKSKTMLRSNMTLHNNEQKEIGYVSSGCYSPMLKKSIGIGYINKISEISEKIFVKVRDKFEEIKLEQIPFIKKKYKKGEHND